MLFQRIHMVEVRTQPEPKCPIRPGEACSLCVPGVSGPQDCGLVYLVMSDPDLRDVSGCTIFALPRSDPSVEAQDTTRLIWRVIDPAKA